jgi:hypothetical protein
MKQGAEFLTYKGVLFSSTIYALASPSFDPYVSTVALFHVFEMARKRDLCPAVASQIHNRRRRKRIGTY